MHERYEPYVADPAEPAGRPVLERWRPLAWFALVLILLIAGSSLYLEGRGEEDPALQFPAQDANP